MGPFDDQSVGSREISHRLVILRAGAKTGARRLVQFLEQVCEALAVAQRQTDGQIQARVALKTSDGSEPFGYRWHMASENLFCRPGWQRERQQTGHYHRKCVKAACWKLGWLCILAEAQRKGRQGGRQRDQPHK